MPAQEGRDDPLRIRLHEMQQQVERLKAEGLDERAEALAAKAREMRAQMRPRAGEERQERPGDDLREILQGLEQGMRALRALGRRAELEAVEHVAADARARLEKIERGAPARGREVRPDDDRERQVARETIEALRMAKEAIAKTGREDSVELVERAIAAREVSLEGRRDEEAKAIRERGPDHAAQTELLGWGAKLLREQGEAEQAAHVGRIAEQFLARHRRQQEQGRQQKERQEEPRQREPAAPSREGRERANANVDELGQRLRAMEEAMREMQGQLEELRRRQIR